LGLQDQPVPAISQSAISPSLSTGCSCWQLQFIGKIIQVLCVLLCFSKPILGNPCKGGVMSTQIERMQTNLYRKHSGVPSEFLKELNPWLSWFTVFETQDRKEFWDRSESRGSWLEPTWILMVGPRWLRRLLQIKSLIGYHYSYSVKWLSWIFAT